MHYSSEVNVFIFVGERVCGCTSDVESMFAYWQNVGRFIYGETTCTKSISALPESYSENAQVLLLHISGPLSSLNAGFDTLNA
jgi:hypothetical protein